MTMRLMLCPVIPFLLPFTACNKEARIVEGSAKSSASYQSHVGEAKATEEKCMAFEPRPFSTMAPSKQKDGQETADGISCSNTKQVAQIELIKANQKRKSDAAANTSKSPIC